MSLAPADNTTAGKIYFAGWLTMVVGGVGGVPLGLALFNSGQREAFAPLIITEGAGLTLIGISEIVRHSGKSSPKDKIRAGGLTSLGIGLGVLGVPLIVDNDRKLYVIVSSALLAFGTILTAVGEDRANVIWRA